MAVPDADDENISRLRYRVDDQMCLEGMNPDRWRNLIPLAGHLRIGRDHVEEIEQLRMVAQSLSFAKEPEAGFGNIDNIVLGLHGEPEAHC